MVQEMFITHFKYRFGDVFSGFAQHQVMDFSEQVYSGKLTYMNEK